MGVEGTKRMVGRRYWASFMNTGTRQAPVWSRVGEGFTELSQSMGALEYGRHYVHEKTERRDVVGYAPRIAYSCDVYSGDPVIERIGAVTDGELVGAEAQVQIVNVNLYEPVGAEGFRAYLREWTVIPDTKGKGVETLGMTGVFAATGDAVVGVFAQVGEDVWEFVGEG